MEYLEYSEIHASLTVSILPVSLSFNLSLERRPLITINVEPNIDMNNLSHHQNDVDQTHQKRRRGRLGLKRLNQLRSLKAEFKVEEEEKKTTEGKRQRQLYKLGMVRAGVEEQISQASQEHQVVQVLVDLGMTTSR